MATRIQGPTFFDLEVQQPLPPKPSFPFRCSINLALGFLHLSARTALLSSWILKSCFCCLNKQTLHKGALTDNLEEIENFLQQRLLLPNLSSHLPQILGGANVCLVGENGEFYNKWKTDPEAYQRRSSHRARGNQYAIGHFLFWQDRGGNTRFQFEKSPMRGFFNSINHAIDYLRYIRDNKQQGLNGTSPHTEDYCLVIDSTEKKSDIFHCSFSCR